MSENLFAGVYNKLKIPVIICRKDPALPITFLNGSARLIFTPGLSVELMGGGERTMHFQDVVRFSAPEEYAAFQQQLLETGLVEDMDVKILSSRNDTIEARINANAGTVHGENLLFIYLGDSPSLHARQPGGGQGLEFMSRILQASHSSSNVDEAIQTILGLAGSYADVSRAYIFEDIPGNATRNTYEWCAAGVKPAIQDLQRLEKKDYNYAAIMNSAGMVITEDTSKLPESDRRILELQGVKAIAILPLYHYDEPLGYMGFDDCVTNRHWSMEEIQLLQNAASVISSLINRRNAEHESRRSREIVQTVTDNLDDLVYISDLDTFELKFISKSLAKAVRLPPEQILGQPCWKILHRGQIGPCPFCPLQKLRERLKIGETGPYLWELHNSVTGKWYLVKDTIITWVDGKPAHLGTYVDITYRKQYEEQLKRFAATDAMTDVYNRKWGYGKLRELFQEPEEVRSQKTLCFIDLDGLKAVNDRFGHATGDEMIVNTVRTIFSCVRKNDFISRWGGDEFILLLHCTQSDAEKVIEKIRFGLEHFNQTAGKPYSLSISCGLVDFASPFACLEDLIDEADRRMYQDKIKKKHISESGAFS